MMTDQVKAILAAVIVLIVGILFIIQAHSRGWPELWSDIAIWLGIGTCILISFWLLQRRARTSKKRPPMISN